MLGKRRTKIVASIGPVTENDGAIRELLEAGVNVFRLNFSHGSHAEHGERIRRIRRISRETGRMVAILQDIQGPKIRVGDMEAGTLLKAGQRFLLTPREILGTAREAHVSFERLADDIPVGATVLLDDGKLELKVVAIDGRDLVTEVVLGGPLSSHKGVNFPGVTLKISVLTEKDKADLRFGAERGVDLVAASFIQQPGDILEIKDFLATECHRMVPLIAKIERQEAVRRISDILAVTDGIMVARGDLGVEMPFEDLPMIQKRIIREANLAGKPVITATQMLDSMINAPRPTRAEASDVANAILDGTDAVMLSNETAVGKYPVLAVETMVKIARETEKFFPERVERPELDRPYVRPIQDAIGHAATHMAPELDAAAIITPTSRGASARMVAKYRPTMPIIAISPSEEVCRQLCLVWGVYPLHVRQAGNTDQLTESSIQAALEAGLVKNGDIAILVFGVPIGVAGSTNLIKVEVVASILARGLGLGKRAASGIARSFKDPETAARDIAPGEILIAPSTDAAWVPAMMKAAGVAVLSSGLSSHTALVGLELGIPVILGLDSLEKIPQGEVITLDPGRGIIYRGQVKV